MNPQLQRRISLVLRRAHCFSVSHSPEGSTVVRSRLSGLLPHRHSLYDHPLKPQRTDNKGHLAHDNDRLIEMQIP
jgi:hypothetical protein